jgi:hypothetical protein
MTDNITNRIIEVIQQVTQEQIVHLLGVGAGRYKQYLESEPEIIDEYSFTWAVDEFLGPQGVGCIFRFYARKDGQCWTLIDGHGPGYQEGPEGPWEEVVEEVSK